MERLTFGIVATLVVDGDPVHLPERHLLLVGVKAGFYFAFGFSHAMLIRAYSPNISLAALSRAFAAFNSQSK